MRVASLDAHTVCRLAFVRRAIINTVMRAGFEYMRLL